MAPYNETGISESNDKIIDFINYDKNDGKFFYALNIFCILYFFIPLIWIIPYRHWYIIKQRNFILTFIGGIFNFLSTFSNLITQIAKIPCGFSYYCATVATACMQICFTNRAFRLIALYKLNIFKVTELSQKKFIQKSQNATIVEPNIYYKSIYRMVNKKWAYLFNIFLMGISTAISIFLHWNTERQSDKMICGFTKAVDINSKISQGAQNTKSNGAREENGNYDILLGGMTSMFMLPMYFGLIFTVTCLIITAIFIFTNIKDDQTFGIKFDCLSNAVVSFITEIIYILFKAGTEKIMQAENNGFLSIVREFYLATKGGILLFVFIGFYLHLTSVIIPLIKCIKAEKLDKKYVNEPTNTMQYFYKILNSPNLVEELKSIAIQEFVVENVLFWENYCILQRLVTKAKHKQEFGNNENSSSSHHQKFSLQDIYSQNSGNSHDEESYDPNYPLLPQLVPYFNAFYHTFIDIDGPAAVNISGSTVRRIYHDFYTYPTVGIFDEAKDEVVESMYLAIFPILLQQNRKQLGDIYSQHHH